jgi:hypothetical protein
VACHAGPPLIGSAWPDRPRSRGCGGGGGRAGDKRSHRLEAHAAAILASVDEMPDITRAEIVAHLQERHDPTVAPRARVKGHGLAVARPDTGSASRQAAHAAAPQQADVR